MNRSQFFLIRCFSMLPAGHCSGFYRSICQWLIICFQFYLKSRSIFRRSCREFYLKTCLDSVSVSSLYVSCDITMFSLFSVNCICNCIVLLVTIITFIFAFYLVGVSIIFSAIGEVWKFCCCISKINADPGFYYRGNSFCKSHIES